MATSQIISMLSSPLELDREKGVQLIETSLLDAGEQYKVELCRQLIAMLSEGDESHSWESKHGAFLGLKVILRYMNVPHFENRENCDDELLVTIKKLAHEHIYDNGAKVGIAAARVLAELGCVNVRESILEEPQVYVEDGAAIPSEMLAKYREQRQMSDEETFPYSPGWAAENRIVLQAMNMAGGYPFKLFTDQEFDDLCQY